MGKSDIHLVSGDDEVEHQFRAVMRRLAGGVTIITAGRDEDITGMTVTSLTSLSASPPRLLVSVNRQASSFARSRATAYSASTFWDRISRPSPGASATEA